MPLRDTARMVRTGRDRPASTTNVLESKYVKISYLPRWSKPSAVYAWLFGSKDNIVDIFMEGRGPPTAWVEFSTAVEAANTASRLDRGFVCSHHRRIQARLVPPKEVPSDEDCKLRYSDFVKKQSQDEASVSSIILITHLPETKMEKNVEDMARKLSLDDLNESDDEQRHGIKATSSIPGGLQVEFKCVEDAERFYEAYDGRYWKNDTIHIEYRRMRRDKRCR